MNETIPSKLNHLDAAAHSSQSNSSNKLRDEKWKKLLRKIERHKHANQLLPSDVSINNGLKENDKKLGASRVQSS